MLGGGDLPYLEIADLPYSRTPGAAPHAPRHPAAQDTYHRDALDESDTVVPLAKRCGAALPTYPIGRPTLYLPYRRCPRDHVPTYPVPTLQEMSPRPCLDLSYMRLTRQT